MEGKFRLEQKRNLLSSPDERLLAIGKSKGVSRLATVTVQILDASKWRELYVNSRPGL